MISFFRKDFLLYWRNRKEIIISLITPIVIIVVLGFALPGWVENPTKSLEMQVAIVQLDDEAAALEQFLQTLSSQALTGEELLAVQQGAEAIQPRQWLEQVLGNEGVEAFIKLHSMDYAEATEQLKSKELTAAIVIPEGFTLATLNKMLLNSENGAILTIMAEDASFKVSMLSNIINNFMHTLNYQAAIGQILEHNEAEAIRAISELAASGSIGGREIVAGVQVVTSFQYYALAISIIFALLMSTTVAAKAVTEKRERIFNRILLSGSRPVQYLFGKFSSTFVLSLAQLTIILLVSHFILNIFPDRSMSFWFGLASVFVMLALCIGGLTALFTALIFRMEEDMANGITFLALLLAGTIGGSFVPIYALPSWLKAVGEWTPNGLALSVLLRWLQTENADDLVMPLMLLTVFIVIVLGAAIWIFPRKGHKA